MSPENLAKSRLAAAENGEAGEALVQAYLEKQAAVTACEWASRLNAVAPYDFRLTLAGADEMVDVKTTVGGFDTAFHLSLNELKQAVCAPGVYRIYRVYDIRGQPRLRISTDLKAFAAALWAQVQGLPAGVMADGFTLKPTLLAASFLFGPPLPLFPADD